MMKIVAARVSLVIAAISAAACSATTDSHATTPWFAAPMAALTHKLSPNNYVATYQTAETPSYVALGTDGLLWFTTPDYVASISSTGTETYYANSAGFATRIASGKTARMWFTELNQDIGAIQESSGAITTYTVPGAMKTYDIALGPDGAMWFTDQGSHAIGRIDGTGASKIFSIPSGAVPIGITAGPDGLVWFTAVGGPNVQEFGKLTTTGSFTEYPIPSGDAGQPGAMTKGPDGNLYSTNSNGGVYAASTSGSIAYYPTSIGANFEDGIAVGPDKQIWISPGDSADDLVEFNPKTKTFSKAAAVPTATFCQQGLQAIPRGLALGPGGDMWFATENCAYIGEYEETISTVGVRLTGEASINDPHYGFELGYFNGTKSLTSQTVVLAAGESVRFQNVDASKTHTASFLGDATQNSAPWPSSFDGGSTQSPAGTVISTANWSTGPLAPGKSSLVYETGMPGFYMIGCYFHYNPDKMRTVLIVR